MRDKPILYPKESKPEKALRTVKSFVDIFCSVPIVGPAIGASLERVLSSMQQQRLDEFVEQVSDMLSSMPEAIYSSEEFTDATRQNLKKCVNENSKKKRATFHNIYKSYLRCTKSVPYSQYDMFINIADALSENSFLLLAEIDALLKKKSILRRMTLENHLEKKFGWSEGYQIRYVSELMSQGLVQQESFGDWVEPDESNYVEIPSDSEKQVSITDVGKEFLKWIESGA